MVNDLGSNFRNFYLILSKITSDEKLRRVFTKPFFEDFRTILKGIVYDSVEDKYSNILSYLYLVDTLPTCLFVSGKHHFGHI